MTSSEHDVVVVGSGATGGWAAKELTERGLRVLVLDAGPEVPLDDATRGAWVPSHRRLPRATPSRQSVQARHPVFSHHTSKFFVDDVHHPFTTPADKPFTWIRGRQVGGRTLTWGGVCLRLSDYELAAGTRGRRAPEHDWPLTYADLAPHYATVERFLGVWGTAENLPQAPDGIYERPSELTGAERRLKSNVEAAWPGARLIPQRGMPARPREGSGSRWPRHTSQGSTLAAALDTGRATLRADAVVTEVLVDENSGRASGVHYIDAKTRAMFQVRAAAVVLAAGTLETTRLLLLSATRQHPAGLGNSSGVLGHYLMDHGSCALRCSGPGDERHPHGGPHAFHIPRFRDLIGGGRPSRGGFGIWGGIGRSAPTALFAAICEMLPRFENFVRLDPEVRDVWGLPVLRIECAFGEDDLRLVADAKETVYELAKMAGVTPEHYGESEPGLLVHEVGTARMGRDPTTSVVDSYGQCWDVPNLFVVDGACWPTSAYQNPTLTMMCLAVRASERLHRFLVRGAREEA
jgi:choline dehydrogenase-like flavoprotein